MVLADWEAKNLQVGALSALLRPVPTPPPARFHLDGYGGTDRHALARFETDHGDPQPGMWHCRCPLGRAQGTYRDATILWVREAAYIAPPNFGDVRDRWERLDEQGRRRIVGYVANMDADSIDIAERYGVKRTPAIQMPRWASRFRLRVMATDVYRDGEKWMWRVDVERIPETSVVMGEAS